MKTATVPAQITTVEDKIAGNLTLQQIALLIGPIFIDFAFYVALPTILKLNIYKLILMAIVTLMAGIAAVRVKGKILLVWAMTIFKYNARPHYYVFNKNNSYLRSEATETSIEPAEIKTIRVKEQTVSSNLSENDVFKLERILASPSTNLSFAASRKGGLHVSITEVK
jgi:hypothetical protein